MRKVLWAPGAHSRSDCPLRKHCTEIADFCRQTQETKLLIEATGNPEIRFIKSGDRPLVYFCREKSFSRNTRDRKTELPTKYRFHNRPGS